VQIRGDAIQTARTRRLQTMPHESAGKIGDQRSPTTSPGGQESTLLGRTLRAGIRVREPLGDTPVGPLYAGEYPTGAEVVVLLLGSASADSVALTVLRQRFRHAIQIQHPNVAAIHELSETHDGLVYVVAECLQGELLSETLARRGALSLEESLDLCLQVAAGLEAAHQARWVHGNVSPETILLTTTDGGRPLVKLIGFTQEPPLGRPGSGRAADPEIAEYASPERLAGRPLDERSDVFSLGAVLHHLLTGVPPTLAAEGGRIPEAMHAVLNRALAPSPARRYQTVAEFVAAIAPPVAEVGLLIPEPARARRRIAVPLTAAAAALVAVSAGVWLLWGTQRPTAGASTRSRSQESGAVAVVEPDSPPALSSASASARVPARTSPVARVRRDSVAVRVPAASSSRRPDSTASGDSLPALRISPFRRSHPWVAVVGERYYYRSGCPVALQSRDLLYFKSEAEARASGFIPNAVTGCD
jgi:serine/threonine protein kinase